MMAYKSASQRLNLKHGPAKIAVLVFFLALAGCMKPTGRTGDYGAQVAPGNEELSAASFYAETVEGKSVDPQFMQGFSIPVSKSFNFSVCLHDSRTREALVGHPFKITGGAAELNLKTDVKGCLNWAEQVAFNFISDEKYVTLARVVRATGMHAGARELKIGVNPWNLSGRSEVVDLSKTKLPEEHLVAASEAEATLSGRSASGATSEKPLWVSSLELQVEPAKAGVASLERNLAFTLKPSILMNDLNGKRVAYELRDAKLKFSARLAFESSGQTHLLWSVANQPVVREGDLYRVIAKSNVDVRGTSGRMLLSVRVSPDAGPEGLKSFDATYQVSGSDVLGYGPRALQRVATSVDGNFDFGSAARAQPVIVGGEKESAANAGAAGSKNSSAPPRSAALPPGIAKAKRFEIELQRPELLGTAEVHTSSIRTVSFAVTACVTDMESGAPRPASDLEFTVQKVDGSKEKVRTKNTKNFEGCLRWHDRITHNYYEPEQYLIKTIVISHESGFEERHEIALLPWDRFNFGRLPVNDGAEIRAVNSRPKKPSRLFIDQANFDAIDHRTYDLDEFLNLSVVKRLRLRIPLKAIRYSSVLNGGFHPQEFMNDGVYLVRAALRVEAKDPGTGEVTELISVMKGERRLMRVRGGTGEIDADFAVRDWRIFKARGNLFIRVQPLREDLLPKEVRETLVSGDLDLESFLDRTATFVTPTYVGAVWLRDEGGTFNLFPTDDMNADPATDGKLPVAEKAKKAARPYAGLTVEGLIAKKKAFDRAYSQRMRAQVPLVGILESYNLEYVPLYNQEKILADEPRLQAVNRVLQPKTAAASLLKALNLPVALGGRMGETFPRSQLKAAVTMETLRDVVEGRREFDRAMAERLCVMYFRDFLPSLKAGAKERGYNPWPIISMCGRAVADDARNMFVVDRKLRVFNAGMPQVLPGYALHFGIGADVGFSRSESRSMSVGGNIGGGMSLGKILPVASIVDDMIGIGVNASAGVGFQSQQSRGQGSSFSSGTDLNMEQVNVRIPFKRYESCMVVRLSPAFWEHNPRTAAYLTKLLAGGDQSEGAATLTRGLFVCTGYQNSNPIERIERYYSFAQGSFDQTALDQGDLANHPWFLSFRGESDYWQFMKLLEARQLGASNVPHKIEVGALPLERLNDAYSVYRGAMTTIPGLYTQHVPIPEEKAPLHKRILDFDYSGFVDRIF